MIARSEARAARVSKSKGSRIPPKKVDASQAEAACAGAAAVARGAAQAGGATSTIGRSWRSIRRPEVLDLLPPGSVI